MRCPSWRCRQNCEVGRIVGRVGRVKRGVGGRGYEVKKWKRGRKAEASRGK